jgi:hypothetical protein
MGLEEAFEYFKNFSTAKPDSDEKIGRRLVTRATSIPAGKPWMRDGDRFDSAGHP